MRAHRSRAADPGNRSRRLAGGDRSAFSTRRSTFTFAAEESVLFPAALQFGELIPLVEELRAEHTALRECFSEAAMRSMSVERMVAFARQAFCAHSQRGTATLRALATVNDCGRTRRSRNKTGSRPQRGRKILHSNQRGNAAESARVVGCG